MPTQQVMPVQCPNCNSQFTAPIENKIDGQDMAMKSALLQGSLNATQCPQCGVTFVPNIPLYYYDLEKELAFVLVPTNLNVSGTTQEKVIGDLSNELVNSLPSEQRKFYLFNPKQFLTRESLIKAILEADGISEETLEAQASKAKLIEEFLNSRDDNELKEKLKAHEDELDEEFFEILTAYMQMAQASGDQARFQAFFALRTVLSNLSKKGKEIVAEIDNRLGLMVIQSQEELLEKLQNAGDKEERASLVSAGHAMLDYGFFQKLTAKIDESTKKGDTKTTQSLKELRTEVLDLKAQYEAEMQQSMEKAANLLKEILQSGSPDKLLAEKLDEIDDAFFFILQANIEEARRQGHQEPAKALEMIGNMAMSMLQEKYGSEADATEEPSGEKPEILVGR